MTQVIDGFFQSNGYYWLSNFYEFDTGYIHGYTSTEAYYQAYKTLNLDERYTFQKMDARTSKKEGRKLTLREDWEVVKDAVMYAALREKFCHPELRNLLIGTGDTMLIEGNTWHDNYWGDCRCYETNQADPGTQAWSCITRGKNMLGTQLMMVRASIRGIL